MLISHTQTFVFCVDWEVTQVRTKHIIDTVDKLVKKYHTSDPYELCKLLGIKISLLRLGKKLKGFFFTNPDRK